MAYCGLRPITKKDCKILPILFEKELGSDAWDEKMIMDSIKNDNTFGHVVVINDAIIGAILFDCNDFETCILELVVAEKFQRKQLGSKLFELVKQYSMSKKHELIYLEVKSTNEKAISFYQKHGLSKIYERKNYYKDGTNAIIMGLNL